MKWPKRELMGNTNRRGFAMVILALWAVLWFIIGIFQLLAAAADVPATLGSPALSFLIATVAFTGVVIVHRMEKSQRAVERDKSTKKHPIVLNHEL
jgi:hypothetical protein